MLPRTGRGIRTMKRSFPSILATIALAVSVLPLPQQALATLGEPADSIAADRRALAAAHRATMVHKSYTVQEATSASTTVREYVTLSGVVFAVAWKGLMHPDLTPLLGTYGPEYRGA